MIVFNLTQFVICKREFITTFLVFGLLLGCSYKNIDTSGLLVKDSFQATEVPGGYLAEISKKVMEYGGNTFDATIASLLLSYRVSPKQAGPGSVGQCLVYDFHNKQTEKLKFIYDSLESGSNQKVDYILSYHGSLGNLLVYLHKKYSNLSWEKLLDVAYQSVDFEALDEVLAKKIDHKSSQKKEDLDLYNNLVYSELLKSFKLKYRKFQNNNFDDKASPIFEADGIDNKSDLRFLLGFTHHNTYVYQNTNWRLIFNDHKTSVYIENLLRIVEEFHSKGILKTYSNNNQHFFINLFSRLVRFDKDYEKVLFSRLITKEEISQIINIDAREDFMFDKLISDSSKRELFTALLSQEKVGNIFSFSIVDIKGNVSNCYLSKPKEQAFEKKYGIFQSYFDKITRVKEPNLGDTSDILNSVVIIEYNRKGKRYFTGIIDTGADKFSANNLFFAIASIIYFKKDIYEVIRSRRFDIEEGIFVSEDFDSFFGSINGIICPEGIPTTDTSVLICTAERDPRIRGIANVRTK